MSRPGVRGLLLAAVLLGTGGLAAELALMEHWDSFSQWVPFAALTLALASTVALLYRATRATVASFRTAMVLLVAVGVVGVWLHYRGNAAFELEIAPGLRGLALTWKALRGAVPALAPGALVQLGLVGLIATYRHPALERGENRPQESHR